MPRNTAKPQRDRFRYESRRLLPGLLGLDLFEVRSGFVRGRMDIKPHHLAPNGYLHAASVIALADSACGRGCVATLPEGASSFTTIELKANFLGTAVAAQSWPKRTSRTAAARLKCGTLP